MNKEAIMHFFPQICTAHMTNADSYSVYRQSKLWKQNMCHTVHVIVIVHAHCETLISGILYQSLLLHNKLLQTSD